MLGAALLFLVVDRLLDLTISLLGPDLDTGRQHLLQFPLISCLLLLLSLGEELAILLQLLDALLFLLLLGRFGLLAALLLLSSESLVLLLTCLSLGLQSSLLLFFASELFLLLLDRGDVCGNLLLFAPGLRGGCGSGRGGSSSLLFGGSSLCRLGFRRGGTTLLLRSLG